MTSTRISFAALVGAATRLRPVAAARPWGRLDLRPWSDCAPAELTGEMSYTPPGGDDAELLVKALFTGERLSVQVHPGNAAALAAGYRRGKDEAWIVLAAEPWSTIGLGLVRDVDTTELAAAARDGSIEHLLDWRPCRAGDVFFAPAGTIHAIGAGITLIEVQQNLDLTYRLFDYGRPRELHLGAGIAVANLGPWQRQPPARRLGDGREVLVEGPSFVVERIRCAGKASLSPAGQPATLVMLSGDGLIDGEPCSGGEVWLVERGCDVALAGAEILFAYPGAEVLPGVYAARR